MVPSAIDQCLQDRDADTLALHLGDDVDRVLHGACVRSAFLVLAEGPEPDELVVDLGDQNIGRF